MYQRSGSLGIIRSAGARPDSRAGLSAIDYLLPTSSYLFALNMSGTQVGPGLEICLRVGTEKAKALAAKHGK